MRMATIVAAALALAGCAAQGDRLSPPQSSRAVRTSLEEAIRRNDRVAVGQGAADLAEMGGSLSPAGIAAIAPLMDGAALRARRGWWNFPQGVDPVVRITATLANNGLSASETGILPRAEVPADYALVEGIAWEAPRGRLFVGTVVEGRLAYLEAGAWHEVPLEGAHGGLFGMAVDAPRRLLWIGTGVAKPTRVREPMAGLIAVDLATLRVVRRVALPGDAPGIAGDVAVAPDGTVYASNSETGAIHVLRPGSDTLQTLVAPGTLRNPQGMAVLRKGSRLIVADYASGLWSVDTRTGAAAPIRVDRPQMLDGIDGLVALPADPYAGGPELVAIQNGTRPRRIVKLRLDPGAKRLEALSPLATLAPDRPEPTLGALRETELWFVGDGQWERHGPGGAITDGAPARPTPILRLPTSDLIITSQTR